jgi:4-hydroxy-tetrahydrodipicolinate synthase
MTPNFLLSRPMFNGSIVALVTPFTEQGEIDSEALTGLVDFHLSNGSDGLVVAGTTGESAALNGDEFCQVLQQVADRVAGRVPVLAGTGSASTRATIKQTAIAAEYGADAVLVVTPYYVKPPQSGLEAHYRAIADVSKVPVVLYNVPSRTAVDMLPATVERLSAHDRIVGVKEAVPDASRIEELCGRCGSGFSILSGDDDSCLDAKKHGAHGVISVAANVAPGQMHELSKAAARHDWAAAGQINSSLKALFEVLMIETNPIPVKWALFEMGLIGSGVRLPLTRLSKTSRTGVRQALSELRLLED